MTKFFYIKYKNEHPDEEIDPKPFEYPGPNPFTREQAILMIADGVEAASRSITEYTEENIATLVNKIIDGDVAENGQHPVLPLPRYRSEAVGLDFGAYRWYDSIVDICPR